MEHYRGSFGKNKGLVLEEYRRAGVKVKADKLDYNLEIHKQMEDKAKQRAKGTLLL